jgi:hypothetical protein
MAVGIPAEQANRLGYEDRVPLDGNGTTQDSATELLPTQTNVAMGTSAGDTAFRLPAEAEFFQEYFLLNTTAETALIFPPVGDTIDANAVDASVEIETDLARVFMRVEEGRWVSMPSGEGGGGIESVVAGIGINVDNTDPDNPVVSNDGVLSVSGGTGISVDVTDPQNPVVINAGVVSVNGQTGNASLDATDVGAVAAIVAGANITVDATDPQNPIVSATVPPSGVETVVAGTGIDVDATDPENPIVALDPAADVRNYLDTGPYVANRAALAALDTTKDSVAILKEAGREGVFVWNGSNLSALVTIDTQQGIYVAPASAPTGASGAWVRVHQASTYTASWFGVAGDGTNQTTALQALIDFIPALATALSLGNGGTVYISGNVVFTTLDMSDSVDIHFVGTGGLNAGAGSACIWRSSSAASIVIDCRSSMGATWENIDFIFSANAGNAFDFARNAGGLNTDSVFMHFVRCSFFATGTASSMHLLSLDGATRGLFEHCNFAGQSPLVWGRNTAGGGNGFSNVMNFISCNFQPSSAGNTYPVYNPGEAWAFVNCTFEGNNNAGYQAAISCTEDALNLSLINCWSGDATVTGGQLIVFQGKGLVVTGCVLQGASNSGNEGINIANNADGIVIEGNYFNSIGNCIVLGTGVTNVQVSGNAKGSVGAFTAGSAPASGRVMDGPTQRLYGNAGRGAPVTKTANFTVADTENWLINNKSGSSCTVTLPAAASYLGREIMFQSYQAQTTISASANVVQKGGATTTTAMLPATIGAWCVLVSNGTNWVIMMSGT